MSKKRYILLLLTIVITIVGCVVASIAYFEYKEEQKKREENMRNFQIEMQQKHEEIEQFMHDNPIDEYIGDE